MNTFFQDRTSNERKIKGRLVLVGFRIASIISTMPQCLKWLFLPYVVAYRVLIEWILCIELPLKLKVGHGLRLYHGAALVVNDRAIIGSNCVLRHSTTIGVSLTSSRFDGDAPVIGNNVDIGSNVVILGKITIGDGAIIGAGSVVVKDVPPNAIVVGNPARVIRFTDAAETVGNV